MMSDDGNDEWSVWRVLALAIFLGGVITVCIICADFAKVAVSS